MKSSKQISSMQTSTGKKRNNFITGKKFTFLITAIIGMLTLRAIPAKAQTNINIDDEPYLLTPTCTNWLCPVGSTTPTFYGTVQNANQLYDALSCLYLKWQFLSSPPSTYSCAPANDPTCYTGSVDCATPIIIQIEPGFDINFDLLNPDVFPIEVPPGVIIQGDYDFSNIDPTTGQSRGTRIHFPYLYEYGTQNTVPHPPDDHTTNYQFFQPSASCNQNPAAIFRMHDGSKIEKICFVGPKDDTKDWRWEPLTDSCVGLGNAGYVKQIHEGIVGGILVQGNNCTIDSCEIYGFPNFGVLVRDMVNTYRTL